MNYIHITKDDMLNGDGIRVVLWVSGCSHKCKGCHNPETWDCDVGEEFTDNTIQEIFTELDKDYISGLTISGGDPLYEANRGQITAFCRLVKETYPSKSIWLYTGFKYDTIKDLEILKYIDVLCDGPYIEELKSPEKHWVGSSNQNVIRFN